MNLWTMGVSTLVVLTVVLVPIGVPSAPSIHPEVSPASWVTRIAVAVIIP